MKSYEERYAEAKTIYQQGLKNVAEKPQPAGQKFPVRSFVQISKDLGESMSYFTSGVPAMVEYTYAHAYGGTNINGYSLLVRRSENNWSSSAWYNEEQLELITDEILIVKYTEEVKTSCENTTA